MLTNVTTIAQSAASNFFNMTSRTYIRMPTVDTTRIMNAMPVYWICRMEDTSSSTEIVGATVVMFAAFSKLKSSRSISKAQATDQYIRNKEGQSQRSDEAGASFYSRRPGPGSYHTPRAFERVGPGTWRGFSGLVLDGRHVVFVIP